MELWGARVGGTEWTHCCFSFLVLSTIGKKGATVLGWIPKPLCKPGSFTAKIPVVSSKEASPKPLEIHKKRDQQYLLLWHLTFRGILLLNMEVLYIAASSPWQTHPLHICFIFFKNSNLVAIYSTPFPQPTHIHIHSLLKSWYIHLIFHCLSWPFCWSKQSPFKSKQS